MSSKYSLRNKTTTTHLSLIQNDELQVKKRHKKSSNIMQSSDYFNDKLPNECLLKILSYLNEKDLLNVCKTCQKLNQVANDANLWKNLYMNLFGISKILSKSAENSLKFENEDKVNRWKKAFLEFGQACHVIQSNVELKRVMKLNESLKRDIYLVNKIDLALDICKTTGTKYILVHKGNYKNENLNIDFNVKIVGLTSIDNDVNISSSKHSTVKFSTENVTSAYLGYCSLNFNAPPENLNVSKQFTIEITSGSKPTIEKCTIRSTSTAGAAVSIKNEHTNPTLKECVIVDCENVGIFIHDFANGTIVENEIARNALAGIWVKSHANPIVKSNKIHDGRDVGIFVFDKGMGLFDSNDIYANRIAGFECKAESNPTVINNKIHHGLTGGIYIHENGRGQYLSNYIYANNQTGIWISKSDPTIKDNHIYDSCQGGIFLYHEAKGLVLENNIYNNSLAGIQISSNSNPIVRKNRIYNGQHGGIYIHENGRGLIEENDIYNNKLADIWVTTGASPHIRLNRIHSGKNIGIHYYDNGNGILEYNDIYEHSHAGIQLRSESNPLIRHNRIWSNLRSGILCINSAKSQIESNEIFDNHNDAGVYVKSNSAPLITSNKIYSNNYFGIKVSSNSKATIANNFIFLSKQSNILISENRLLVTIRNNQIYEACTSGIDIQESSNVIIEANKIFNNKYGALFSTLNSNFLMNSNDLYNNHDLVQKTLESGECLLSIVNGNSSIKVISDYYKCGTCSIDAIYCKSCIDICHAGHDIELNKNDRLQCQCSHEDGNCCKLITQEKELVAASDTKLNQKSSKISF